MNKLWIITVYILAVLAAGRTCWAFDNGDFQAWFTSDASVDLTKDWTVTLEEQVKFGDDAGKFYYHHADIGFVYKGLASWIELGFNYRQIYETDNGQWYWEHRPHFNTTIKWRFCGFDISSRFRLDYRDREINEDMWRYRNKVTVKLPLELTPLKLQLYFAEESFLNFEGKAFSANRLYAGFIFPVSGKTRGEIFYLLETKRAEDDWLATNVLGIQLKLAF